MSFYELNGCFRSHWSLSNFGEEALLQKFVLLRILVHLVGSPQSSGAALQHRAEAAQLMAGVAVQASRLSTPGLTKSHVFQLTNVGNSQTFCDRIPYPHIFPGCFSEPHSDIEGKNANTQILMISPHDIIDAHDVTTAGWRYIDRIGWVLVV